ncbi:hypothetical protein VPH35_140554 [Triticum aestivum]|uniref:Uncharacterized protein n=1 Tax=Aegilops tauschii TaxID=37682 RepID=M8B9R8_AEGTA
MDELDWLGIHFFYNGQFEKSRKCVSYVGGHIQVTQIHRDIVTIATVRDQLADIMMAYHVQELTDNHRLYWLFPGKNVRDGRRRSDTDANVHFMDRCITDGGVVDVYVNYEDNGAEDGQDSGSESGEEKEQNDVSNAEEDRAEENTDIDWEDEHENCSVEEDLEHESGEEKEQNDVPLVDVAQDEISDECEDLDWCPRDEDSDGNRSIILKFSYAHQDASMECTSNEGKGVHLHTLVDRERKRFNERG